ncbi:tRNA-(ms[2]io[6]A)-hydroxylase [Spartinivicinus ruber]|uniref:tRNA-(ms[2]io[6]A)-hydroxylase n=1 Tax=Spartinivicinus ruber TaxID=2683272 RepID=UPI0013D09B9A|nr:tRNA isopentenyl-2-thiomethyl-A-37 hydroxylase MiaE [Spartinivicinus ruber]
MKQLPELKDFLLCETPDSWVSAALKHPEILLIDHAHCEKKAAATALNLMFRYVDKVDLLNKMSRLAREELRHFEQVLAIMVKRGVEYTHLSPARYAAELRKLVRTHEPARLVDTLIVGAFIEARSCERFEKLAPYLDEELAKFYLSLLKSEARHFQDYLTLAMAAIDEPIDERVALFAEKEQALVLALDDEFRFHSGPLEAATAE